MLAEFEESLNQRRPKLQQSSSKENAPAVTWSNMMEILGSCPLERLPNCLHPQPSAAFQPCRLLEPKPVNAGGEKRLTIRCFFRPSNTSATSNGSNQECAAAVTNSVPCAQRSCYPAASGRVFDATVENESGRLSRANRPRWKQVAPSRSPLANVFMNC